MLLEGEKGKGLGLGEFDRWIEYWVSRNMSCLSVAGDN